MLGASESINQKYCWLVGFSYNIEKICHVPRPVILTEQLSTKIQPPSSDEPVRWITGFQLLKVSLLSLLLLLTRYSIQLELVSFTSLTSCRERCCQLQVVAIYEQELLQRLTRWDMG
jgi:hypothetical protein